MHIVKFLKHTIAAWRVPVFDWSVLAMCNVRKGYPDNFSYPPRRFSAIIGVWHKSEFPRINDWEDVICFRALILHTMIRKILCLYDSDNIVDATRIFTEDIISTHETLENLWRLTRVSKPNRGRKLQRKMTRNEEKLRPLPQNRLRSKSQTRNRIIIRKVSEPKISEAWVPNWMIFCYYFLLFPLRLL